MKIYKIFFLITLGVIIQSCNAPSNILKIAGTGMYPNILEDQYVKFEKIKKSEPLTYGDMVACYTENYTADGEDKSVSRIVGLPNDTIDVVDDICIINGKKNTFSLKAKDYYLEDSDYYLEYSDRYYYYDLYEETFPNGKTVPILISKNRPSVKTKKIVVPQGMYYIMGDKRSDSFDSRSFGPIPANKILGRAMVLEYVP